jgi:hypothetical protein
MTLRPKISFVFQTFPLEFQIFSLAGFNKINGSKIWFPNFSLAVSWIINWLRRKKLGKRVSQFLLKLRDQRSAYRARILEKA